MRIIGSLRRSPESRDLPQRVSISNTMPRTMIPPADLYPLHYHFCIKLASMRGQTALLTRFSQPDAADAESPLRPDELQVLRAQYDKEGQHVGVQTKFNFAWVNTFPLPPLVELKAHYLSLGLD